MPASELPEGVIIAEATGFAGGGLGPTRPLVELAMHQAVMDCMALGVMDDSPAELVEQITGVAGKTGGEFIRDAKLAARDKVMDEHRGLLKAHEGMKAAELHNARDA